MWCACQGVCRVLSPITGPASSITNAIAPVHSAQTSDCCSTIIAIQTTCAKARKVAYMRAVRRCSGACAATRSHWAICATRMMT